MKEWSVSVVVTTRNRPDFLKRALQSVVDQVDVQMQIIVIDDASDCDNESILEWFDHNILYHREDVCVGANAARNKWISLAEYDAVAFLDDDDEWLSTKLHKQLTVIEDRNASLGVSDDLLEKKFLIYAGKYIVHDNAAGVEISRRYSFWKPLFAKNLVWSISLLNFVGTTSNMMVSKQLLLDVGWFDEKMQAMQDYELSVRLIAAGANVVGIDEWLIVYHAGSDNQNISARWSRVWSAYKRLWAKHSGNGYWYYLLFGILMMIVYYWLWIVVSWCKRN